MRSRGIALGAILLVVGSVVPGCVGFDPLRGLIGSYRNYVDVNGEIRDGRYYEPLGRFSVQVPPLLEPGAVIEGGFEKAGGRISFCDDIGRLIRIDVMTAMEAADEQLLAMPDWRIPLQGNRSLFEMLYRQVIPGVRLEHQEYVIWQQRHADFFVYEMKQGSTLTDVGTGKRLDALRASLSFVQGHSLYTITIQYAGDVWPSDEKRIAILRQMRRELETIADTFQFADALPLE